MSSSPRGWAGLLIPQSQNRLIPSTGAQAPYLSSFPLSFPPSLPSFFLFFLTLLEPRVHFYSAHLTQLQVLPTWTREGDLLVWWPPSQPLARSPCLKVSFALLMSCPWLPRGLYPGVLGSFSDWTQGLPFITENSLLGFRLFSFLSFLFFFAKFYMKAELGTHPLQTTRIKLKPPPVALRAPHSLTTTPPHESASGPVGHTVPQHTLAIIPLFLLTPQSHSSGPGDLLKQSDRPGHLPY